MYIKIKELFMVTVSKTETVAECIHGEDCPLHAENPPFNTKVLAAIAEGDAIFKGEKPAKWYTSLEDAREELGI
jgi:hypothetical protein